MAAPNIVAVTTITGKTVGAALGTGSTDIVTNPAASGKVFKINTIYAANTHESTAADVTIAFFDASAAATYKIAGEITVPTKATLDVASKSIYLEEGDKITALASAASSIELVVSFEELS